MNKKTKTKSAVFFILPLLLCGCSSSEVQDKNYTSELKIDHQKQSVCIEMKFYDSDDTVRAEGSSLADALKTAENKTGMDIFMGHTSLLCLSSDSCRESLLEIKKYCRIPGDSRIIYLSDNSENSSSIAEAEKNMTIPKTNISSALDSLLSPVGSAVLAFSDDNDFSSVVVSENGSCIQLGNMASEGTAFLHNNEKSGIVTINGKSYEIKKIKRKFCADFENGKLRIKISVSFRQENENGEILKNHIKEIVSASVNETLKSGYDIYRISDILQQREYDFYINNKTKLAEYLKNAEYTVDVSCCP